MDFEILYGSRNLTHYEAILEERRSLDSGFERLAAIGGAPHEWVVPQGSV